MLITAELYLQTKLVFIGRRIATFDKASYEQIINFQMKENKISTFRKWVILAEVYTAESYLQDEHWAGLLISSMGMDGGSSRLY